MQAVATGLREGVSKGSAGCVVNGQDTTKQEQRLSFPPHIPLSVFFPSDQQNMAPMPNPEWYQEKEDTRVSLKNLR